MSHPSKTLIIDTLLETARRVAVEVNANYPEDIAIAMMNAIECGAATLQILHENGNLTSEAKV